MENDLYTLLFILIIWLILYLILEFKIINKKRKDVKKLFLEMDNIFFKRLKLLSKVVDIIKAYDRNQFDDFGNKIYDYTNNYFDFDNNKRLKINEDINLEIKKVLLVRKVYPELNDNLKYVKYEKQLVRMNKVLNKLQVKYNKALSAYLNRKKVFPSGLICVMCRFYSYNYFNLNNR